MKKLIFIFITIFMLLMLSACNSKESGLVFSAEEVDPLSKTFNLDQYARMRYDGGYEFGFSFRRYNSEDPTVDSQVELQSLKNEIYIWNLDFRNEFKNIIIQIINELEKIDNDVYGFKIEVTDKFLLYYDDEVLLTLDKNRATAILKIILPTTFDAKVSKLNEGLNSLVNVLETDDDSTDYDIIKLQIDFHVYPLELSLDTSNYIEDCLYGFKNLDEVLAFIDGNYNFIPIDDSSGDNTVDIFKSFICYIHYGEYYWIKVINREDGMYTLTFDGDVKLSFGLFIENNEHYLDLIGFISVSSGINQHGIKCEMKKDEVYYIKLAGMNSKDQGTTTAKLKYEEIKE